MGVVSLALAPRPAPATSRAMKITKMSSLCLARTDQPAQFLGRAASRARKPACDRESDICAGELESQYEARQHKADGVREHDGEGTELQAVDQPHENPMTVMTCIRVEIADTSPLRTIFQRFEPHQPLDGMKATVEAGGEQVVPDPKGAISPGRR